MEAQYRVLMIPMLRKIVAPEKLLGYANRIVQPYMEGMKGKIRKLLEEKRLAQEEAWIKTMDGFLAAECPIQLCVAFTEGMYLCTESFNFSGTLSRD